MLLFFHKFLSGSEEHFSESCTQFSFQVASWHSFLLYFFDSKENFLSWNLSWNRFFSNFSHAVFLSKLNLLGWHWLIKLHRFQVYNSIIIRHLYCIGCSLPRHVSSHHHLSPLYPLLPSPYPLFPMVTTILLSVSIRVCGLFCFVLFCLISSPFYPSSSTPLPSDSCHSLLCTWECLLQQHAWAWTVLC